MSVQSEIKLKRSIESFSLKCFKKGIPGFDPILYSDEMKRFASFCIMTDKKFVREESYFLNNVFNFSAGSGEELTKLADCDGLDPFISELLLPENINIISNHNNLPPSEAPKKEEVYEKLTALYKKFDVLIPKTLKILADYDNSLPSVNGERVNFFTNKLISLYEQISVVAIACDEKNVDEEVYICSFYLRAMKMAAESFLKKESDTDKNKKVVYAKAYFSDNITEKNKDKDKDKDDDDDDDDDNDNDDGNSDLDSCLAELDELIGLEKIKLDVHSLIRLVAVSKIREERGLKSLPISKHMVFYGNPGTGKTTVARLLAKIYHQMGILSKGQLVEVDRSGLVAGYIGQTAIKTKEVIDKALGGILFIDEAYSLTPKNSENDYGREAVDTILKAMEDNRNDFVVIVAGYTNLMAEFINSNPGLRSRFNRYMYFEDYKPEEMTLIFESMCKKAGYKPTKEAVAHTSEVFTEMYNGKGENFANAREVRNFFENSVVKQSVRLYDIKNPTDEELCEITLDDVSFTA